MTQIQGVLIKEVFRHPHDWNIIMATISKYNVNEVITQLDLPWNFSGGDGLELSQSIQAARNAGISKYEVLFLTLTGPRYPEWKAIDYTLTPTNWLCPSKQSVRNAIREVLETLVLDYDVDSLILDYIRYGESTNDNGVIIPPNGICYCPECKAKFEQWLGASITDWPGDFAPGKTRHEDFLDWHPNPITELIQDIRIWVKSIKPKVTLSAAKYHENIWEPPGIIKRIFGQDAQTWVQNNYVDYVSPMIYWDNFDTFQRIFNFELEYIVNGRKDKLVPFITTGGASQNRLPLPINVFDSEVDMCSINASGFRIWKYDGLGLEDPSGIDIEPYLSQLPTLPTPISPLPAVLALAIIPVAVILWWVLRK